MWCSAAKIQEISRRLYAHATMRTLVNLLQNLRFLGWIANTTKEMRCTMTNGQIVKSRLARLLWRIDAPRSARAKHCASPGEPGSALPG